MMMVDRGYDETAVFGVFLVAGRGVFSLFSVDVNSGSVIV